MASCAGPGYDLVTGRGSPNAAAIVSGFSVPLVTLQSGVSYVLQAGTLWGYSSSTGWAIAAGNVRSYSIDPSDRYLFYLTYGGGLYRETVNGPVLIHSTSDIVSFALEPNGSDYMVYLDSSGNLYQNYEDKSGESLLASGIRSYAFDYNGGYTIYLTYGGALYRETQNDAVLIHSASDIVSFAMNGTDYMVYLDSSGNLYQNYEDKSGESLLASGIKSYAFDYNGGYAIYLTYGGDLYRETQNHTVLIHSASDIVSFALDPNGSDYMVYLDSSGNLYQNYEDVSGESLLAPGVKSYAFDYNGMYTIYLTNSGALYRETGNGPVLIHSASDIVSFAMNGTDYMVYLDSSGNLYQNYEDANGESLLASGIRSYAFDYNGMYAIWLTNSGALYRETQNDAVLIHSASDIVSFAMNGTDYMVYLDSSGNLYQNYEDANGESLVATGIKSYAFDYNGVYIIYLTNSGALYRDTQNNAVLIHSASDIVSFAMNGTDYMVYLDSSGNLYQNYEDANGESLVATGIKSYAFDYNGVYIIYLTNSGALYRETQNNAVLIHSASDIVSFAMNGTDYMVYLDSSGNLYQNYEDANGESLVATGIKSYAFDYNGVYIIYLTNSGALYRETQNNAVLIHSALDILSFTLDPNGTDYMVYLDSSGNLFSNLEDASDESRLNSVGVIVRSYYFSSDGQDLYYLDSTGKLHSVLVG